MRLAVRWYVLLKPTRAMINADRLVGPFLPERSR